MSRIAKNPITAPQGVEVQVAGQRVSVKGPKGELALDLHPAVRLVNEEGTWVGEGTITTRNNQGPPTHLAALWRLEGEGAYEGLILEFHSQGDRTGNPSTVWGAIYPAAAVPPVPEAIADGS